MYLTLDLGNGLNMTNGSTVVGVKINQNQSNHLTLKSDGLYLTGLSSSSTSQTFKKYQSHYGIMVDYSPWGDVSKHNEDYVGYVSCSNKTHRIWTASGFDPNTSRPIGLTGKNTQDPFRPELDWVLPGDFFRVPKENGKYDYYIITSVTPNEVDGRYKAGNEVATYALLLENGDDF